MDLLPLAPARALQSFVGIHGTDRPELLPGRVSHGCVRMRNEDIVELGRLMPVGTPVEIR
jgi:lipoprotein-anchoring transpeptidase ErfK/SrfK